MSRRTSASGGGAVVAIIAVLVAIVVAVAVAIGAIALLVLAALWSLSIAALDYRRAKRAGQSRSYWAALRARGAAIAEFVRGGDHRKATLGGCLAAGFALLILAGTLSGGGSSKPEPRADAEAKSTGTAVAVAGATSTKALWHRHSARVQARASRSASVPAPSLGHRTKFASCHVRGVLQDSACTPGAIFAGATVAQVCTPGYSKSVRNVPESLKQTIYAEYGVQSHTPGSYEVDHLISLELGGSNSAANLWPEVSPGYHEKDSIENRLHDAVCSGSMSLHTAQAQIARDWRHTSVGPPNYIPPTTPAAPRSPVRPAPSSRTSADFCTTHRCIASFAEGRGTIVECADGEWSHSGGLPGVCSRHGGVR
jgi:hypothetical protein